MISPKIVLIALASLLSAQLCVALPLASPTKTTTTKTTTTRTTTTSKTTTTKTTTTSKTTSTTTTTTIYSPNPKYPAQFLNLKDDWYLQLPVASTPNGTTFGSSSNPGLQTFSSSNFFVNADKTGVVFNTTNTGVTTGGSTHPRTELRQVTGIAKSWNSSDVGPHELNITLSKDYLPPGIISIFAQLFSVASGAQFTYRVVRQSNGATSIAVCTKSGCYTYDDNYTLGTRFSLQISVSQNMVTSRYLNLGKPLKTNAVMGSTSNPYFHTIPTIPYGDYVFKTGSYCTILKGVQPDDAYCQATFNSITVS
ncbi:alginate lyase-domain-containing protein [Obelidium mucronatum]|nr:alginate lyase-domain-containing protein [Obelidium mucronatum]